MRKNGGNLETDRNDWSFGTLLAWHLTQGTRPPGTPSAQGGRWENKEFARVLNCSDKTVRNWRNDKNLPLTPRRIERALFGEDEVNAAARDELRRAFRRTTGKEPEDASEAVAEPKTGVAPIDPPTRILGRDSETELLAAALTARPQTALLVLGGPGIGKTTLTRAVATHPVVAAAFGQRRVFVPLETATDDATVRIAIVQALGLNPASVKLPEALASLAGAPVLLVLDNLETPWEAEAEPTEQTLALLARTPGVSLLASVRGNAAPPIPRWTRKPTSLSPLPDEAARDLFLELAHGIAAEDPDLDPFLRDLGGIPLAIELVALRAAAETSLRELRAEWNRLGTEFAHRTDRTPTHRLSSLDRSLDLSWASPRLKEPGRRLFRLLGQLPAGVSDLDRNELLGNDAFDARNQLLKLGLCHATVEPRLDLLPPIRRYAANRHRPQNDEHSAWCRHYLALARETGGFILWAGGAEALARLSPEVANIDAALREATAEALRPEAVAALNGVWRLLSATGAGSLAPLHALADACHDAADPAGEAECHFWRGLIAFDRSDHAISEQAFEQALPLYRQVSDVQGEANCIQSLGDIALRRSDHDAARQAYEQAMPRYRQVGDVQGEANCIRSLGDIALERSDHDAARQAYQQAMPLYRQVSDVLGEANCIKSLGDIALARSDHDAARQAYEQAMPLYRQVGAVQGEANCIQSLGDIALERSDHDAARQAYQQAMPLYRQVGDVLGEANCIQSLGDIALERSDHDAARQAYQQAMPLYRQVGAVVGEAICHAMLGRLARMLDDDSMAAHQYRAAITLFERSGARNNLAVVNEHLARVTTGAERDRHVAAAREIWIVLDLPIQLAMHEAEFGQPVAVNAP